MANREELADIAHEMQIRLDKRISKGGIKDFARNSSQALINRLWRIYNDEQLIPHPEVGRAIGKIIDALLKENIDVDGMVIEINFVDNPKPERMYRDALYMSQLREEYGLSS